MITFTKEQLIARINQVTAINKYRISRDPSADGLAMDNELLAIALASLEAEPVAWEWFYYKQWSVTNDPERAKDVADGGVEVFPLYSRAAMLQGADGNSPVIPDGWKLVPVELTGAMTNAMTDAILDDLHNVDLWRSVLAAAPQQEVSRE